MILLFDIGASKIRLATSSNKKDISNIEIFNTPETTKQGIELFKKYINNKKINKIVGGIAGPYPNLPNWNKKKLQKELVKICESVILKNDADLAGLAETALYKNKKAIYLTISTGIGGNFGEPGQIILDKKTGQTFEDLVSGRGMKEIYNKNPEDIKDKEIWDKQTKLLIKGLNIVIDNTHPDVIILGGGLMNKFVISEIKTEPKKIIKKSKYKDLSGLYGALLETNRDKPGGSQ